MPEDRASPHCRIAIAIATYRRPESLERLLTVLGDRADELPGVYEVTAIVVDNDPDASACALVAQEGWGITVHYAHEPTPGIAAARSRLLTEASGHEALVFIDDDEWPTPGWLPELVSMWQQTGATAVMGSVETILPDDVDPWVRAFGIFDRPHRVPGESLPAAATGNLLLDLDQVRRLGLDFDRRLGTRGGEDTLFTRTLVARGGTIVACPGSVALDEPGLGRLTREFTLRRARFHGVTQADIELRLAAGRGRRLASRLRSTAKGLVWIGAGALRAVRGALRHSMRNRAWGARHMQRGLGLLHGAWGNPPSEYARDERRSAAGGCSGVKSWVRSASPFFGSLVAVATREPVVVLTLDDGPDPYWTPRLLDLLRERGATATFFVLLTRTRRYPELLARIVEEGHEVGLHGMDHRRVTTLSRPDFEDQLRVGRRELGAVVGASVRWYRPPYGALTPMRWRVVKRLGMTPVLWNASALDGRDATLEERLRSASQVSGGGVLLAHDARAGRSDGVDDPDISDFDRVALIEMILDGWAERGLRAVSLGEALRNGVPRQAMML